VEKVSRDIVKRRVRLRDVFSRLITFPHVLALSFQLRLS